MFKLSFKSQVLEILEIQEFHFETFKSCNDDLTNNTSDWFTSISKCIPIEDEDQIFKMEGLKIYAISLSIRQRNDYLNFQALHSVSGNTAPI